MSEVAIVGGLAFSVTGIPAIDRKFRALPLRLQKKVIRQAIRPAMNSILLPAARAEAPVRSGALRKSLKVRAAKRTRKAYVSLNLVTSAAGWYKGKTYYGAFVHFGYKRGKRPRKGGSDNRQSVAANPFLTRSYNSAGKRVIADVQQRIAAIVPTVVP